MLVRVKAGLVQRPVACDLAVPLLSHLTRNGKHLSGFAKAKRRPIWRGPTMWESPLSIGWRQPALSQTASRQANKAQAIAHKCYQNLSYHLEGKACRICLPAARGGPILPCVRPGRVRAQRSWRPEIMLLIETLYGRALNTPGIILIDRQCSKKSNPFSPSIFENNADPLEEACFGLCRSPWVAALAAARVPLISTWHDWRPNHACCMTRARTDISAAYGRRVLRWALASGFIW